MKREKFQTRTIRLVGQMQKDAAIAVINNLPIDSDKPLVVTIAEEKKIRGLDANGLMWVGPLKQISEQAWVEGKRYSDVVWHEMFKREFLPEDNDLEIEDLAKSGYQKWAIDPMGNKVLIGSTTQLTKKGFSQYLEQIHAYGASLGVMFSDAPGRYAA
jgi:hypothetical protein